MQTFLSCDWGTTSFRLRLINADTEDVLAETYTQQGIAATNELCTSQLTLARFDYYTHYINTQIQQLEQDLNTSLNNVTLIIAGMASAGIGMKELPYKKMPFIIQPQNLSVDITEATTAFPHKTIIIAGACSATDVMRGEETILAGCAYNTSYKKQLFILPGTHSKHALVENNMLTEVRTYMTGELFQLLSTKSILANSIENNNGDAAINDAFIKGVHDATQSSLLNSIFHVRINTLLNTMGKKDNYHYLSGLLIGEELKQIGQANVDAVTIVSSGNLLALYHTAITTLHKEIQVTTEGADEALIQAQTVLFKHYQ